MQHRPSLLRLFKAALPKFKAATYALSLCLLLFGVSLGCARAPYVWASDIPSERARPDVVASQLQPGDAILLTVVAQAGLSGQHVVGSDGTIAVPNVGAVAVAGLSIERAEEAVKARLTSILAAPEVSLVLVTRHIEVTVLGEAREPGKYQMKAGDGVASALALAGGVTEFGNENAIFLIRSTEPLRIRFRVQDLVRGGESARAFALRDGDLLVIE